MGKRWLRTGIGFFLLATPAWAVLNNGFNTDLLYQPAGATANILTFNPVTGVQVSTFQSGNFWSSMTFAGTGTNDARLFVVMPAGATDVTLSEINSSGTIVNTALLTALTGFPASPTLQNVSIGNLRYSIYHGSLFLCVNANGPTGENSAGTGNATVGTSVAYEINLGLTQVLNTYTGPGNFDGGGFTDGGPPRVDINPNNGTLYMGAMRLNKSTNTEGDLIAFDTSSGSTSTFTVLLNGTTYSAGDATYRNPAGPIFRGTNHPTDTHPTIVIVNSNAQASNNAVVMEFYLDQTDGNGNLLKRRDLYTGVRRPTQGHINQNDGTLMVCRLNAQQSGLHNAGTDQVKSSDVAYRPTFTNTVNNAFFDNAYNDVDTPGFKVSAVEPVDKSTASAYLGNSSTPGSFAFTFRNKGYRNPGNASLPADSNVNRSVSYTVVKVPNDGTTAWLTLDKSGSASPLAPNERDTVTATINSTGLTAGLHSVDLVFTDDASPANVFTRTVEVNVLECSWEVTPTPTTIAYVLAATTPRSYDINVKNVAGAPLSYTVQEVLADGVTPTDYAWLSLNKSGSASPITAGNTDIVQFTVNSPNQANTGYLRFVPSCGTVTSGSQPQVRQIEVINSLVSGAPFVSEYKGDISPEDPNACGPGCHLGLTADIGNFAAGSVAIDSGAVDRKAWHITDDSTPNTWTHFRILDDSPGFTSHNGFLGSTMVVRLKVISDTAAGSLFAINQNAGARNATRLEWGGLGPNLPSLVRENVRGVTGVGNGAVGGDYAVIRVTSGFGITGSRTIKVYVNEDKNPLPSPVQVLLLNNLTQGPSGRGFGYGFGMEGTGGVTGEVYFDYITFTTAGMFGPGEEVPVLGKSLLLKGCHDPYADVEPAPNGDGDVDLNDFAEFQKCYTGVQDLPPALSAICACMDRNSDSNISAFDFDAFRTCGSGAGVPANIACDDGP